MHKKHSDKIRELVKQAYDVIADEFDHTRKKQWLEFEDFLKYVKKGAKVLDAGCGNGRLYDLLKDKKVEYLGVDNNSSLIAKARENFPHAQFQLGDIVDLDLADEHFDAVFSIASFHHIPGRKLRRRAVNEMRRVLKKNGVLILTVWNLFQLKYLAPLMRSIAHFLLHFGLKYAWNDLWVRWGHHPVKRYYHAFLPKELARYFKDWKIEEFYFSRKGSKVKFWRSYNIVLIARKN